MSETKHAILSPSGAAGWLVCAGKPAMEKGLPDGSNEHSEYGVAAHWVAAACLVDGSDPSVFLDKYIDVAKDRTRLCDQEMVDGVRIYVNAIRAEMERLALAGATEVELLVEQRVPVWHITGEEGAEGTADAIITARLPSDEWLCFISDLKFGIGVRVYAENNPQGMLYALGVLRKLSMTHEFTKVVISIHQPRVSAEPSEWEISEADLVAWGESVKPKAFHALAIYTNEKPDAVRHHLEAGDHCRKTFCKARGTCPALAKFVEDSVGAGFDVVTTIPKEMLTLPAAEVGLSTKMQAVDIIEDWCKAVRAEVERRLLAGTDVPGFKLVQGREGARAWGDEDAAEKALKSFRLKIEDMYLMKLVSPTQAEKLVANDKKTGRLPIKLRQWQKLQPLITRSPGKPSVAPASDSRPALTVTPPAEGFTVVEKEGLV